MAKKKLVLVALGGNVLTKKHETGKIGELNNGKMPQKCVLH
jgi:hypothetical protein